MRKTVHFTQRMSQRGIGSRLVQLACLHGTRDHRNRIVLNKREIDLQLAFLTQQKKLFLEARKKGGVVVIEEGGNLITTYICGNKI